MKLLNIIKSDLIRYSGKANTMNFILALRYPGFVYFIFLRLLQSTPLRNPLWFMWRFFLWIFSYRFGFQIPYSVRIGPGLLIAHFGNIIINSKVIIGKNCNLSPNVVIGQTNRGSKRGVPILGDNVWVGCGAAIVGKITIGSNVLIAPNSFVNIDIPENSVVIGNPAKIIYDENATVGYIENQIEN